MPTYFVQAWDPVEMARTPHTPYWIQVVCENEDQAKKAIIRSMLLFAPELTEDYFRNWLFKIEKTGSLDWLGELLEENKQ